MNKPIYNFLSTDHQRLDKLLNEAVSDYNAIDSEKYHQFRVGLLTHIKMEEKILFPAAKKANGNRNLPMIPQLRLEHGAITALMALPPSKDLTKVIRYILNIHDLKEEESGGVYEICERLAETDTAAILQAFRTTTPVPVHPPNASPYVFEAAKRALKRAGFDYDEIVGLNLSE